MVAKSETDGHIQTPGDLRKKLGGKLGMLYKPQLVEMTKETLTMIYNICRLCMLTKEVRLI